MEPPKGTGLASWYHGRTYHLRAMHAAIALADELGIRLSLTPDGTYYEDVEAAAERLRGFYARFGFRSAAFGSMSRDPNQLAQ